MVVAIKLGNLDVRSGENKPVQPKIFQGDTTKLITHLDPSTLKGRCDFVLCGGGPFKKAVAHLVKHLIIFLYQLVKKFIFDVISY